MDKLKENFYDPKFGLQSYDKFIKKYSSELDVCKILIIG